MLKVELFSSVSHTDTWRLTPKKQIFLFQNCHHTIYFLVNQQRVKNQIFLHSWFWFIEPQRDRTLAIKLFCMRLFDYILWLRQVICLCCLPRNGSNHLLSIIIIIKGKLIKSRSGMISNGIARPHIKNVFFNNE